MSLKATGTNDVNNLNPLVQAVIGHLQPPAYYGAIYDHSSLLSLPNRNQNYPQAKLSSWCRRRRQLEEIFKKEDAGEIILTKQKLQTALFYLQ